MNFEKHPSCECGRFAMPRGDRAGLCDICYERELRMSANRKRFRQQIEIANAPFNGLSKIVDMVLGSTKGDRE
jgi:hypothetical protein